MAGLQELELAWSSQILWGVSKMNRPSELLNQPEMSWSGVGSTVGLPILLDNITLFYLPL